MWHVELDGREDFQIDESGPSHVVLIVNGHSAPNTLCIRMPREQWAKLKTVISPSPVPSEDSSR